MTRKTFFRVLLALMNYRHQHLMRWLLPHRMKRPYFNPFVISRMMDAILRQMQKIDLNFSAFRETTQLPKIGDSLFIRRPVRSA